MEDEVGISVRWHYSREGRIGGVEDMEARMPKRKERKDGISDGEI